MDPNDMLKALMGELASERPRHDYILRLLASLKSWVEFDGELPMVTESYSQYTIGDGR